jgi:hypothetical protein
MTIMSAGSMSVETWPHPSERGCRFWLTRWRPSCAATVPVWIQTAQEKLGKTGYTPLIERILD